MVRTQRRLRCEDRCGVNMLIYATLFYVLTSNAVDEDSVIVSIACLCKAGVTSCCDNHLITGSALIRHRQDYI